VIAFVRGTVADVGLTSAVLEVGGVGLQLLCTPATLATLRTGREALLPTSMVVREDSLTLFGFADDDERYVFQLLQTASGVGPKLAQAMLAVHPPDQLRRAVSTDDLTALTQVPGIGRKGAQRIVLELKERLGVPVGARSGINRAQPATATTWRDQVHSGLVGLGWSGREADSAVDAVAPLAQEQLDGGDPDVPVLLRSALRTLSRA
jgi:Holliday junction DNA helicase RuvA